MHSLSRLSPTKHSLACCIGLLAKYQVQCSAKRQRNTPSAVASATSCWSPHGWVSCYLRVMASFQEPQTDDYLGQVVEFGSTRVTLQAVLAEGGFATVYSAADEAGTKYVVKKVIASAPEVERQTALEVKVHSAMKHEHIVKLLGWRAFPLPSGGKTFLSLLEFCPHGDLLQRMTAATGPLSQKSVLKVLVAVCGAVDHLHSETSPPVAHRDIKPENILIGEGGVLKLCDFGSLNEHAGPVTKADRVQVEDDILRFCTPQYRSPELVDTYSGHAVDNRVDIWAIGCLAYALMFQEHPFDITSSLAILSGKYSVPARHTYARELLLALDCCLALDPEHRPTAGSLHEYFRALEAGVTPLPPLVAANGDRAVPQAQEESFADRDTHRHVGPRKHRHAAPAAVVKTDASSAALQRVLAARGVSVQQPAQPASAPDSPGDAFDPFTSQAPAPIPAPAPAPAVQAQHSPVWGGDGDDPFASMPSAAPAASGGAAEADASSAPGLFGDDPFGAPLESTSAPAPAPIEQDAWGAGDDPFALPEAAAATPSSAPTSASEPATQQTQHTPSRQAPRPPSVASQSEESGDDDLLAGAQPSTPATTGTAPQGSVPVPQNYGAPAGYGYGQHPGYAPGFAPRGHPGGYGYTQPPQQPPTAASRISAMGPVPGGYAYGRPPAQGAYYGYR